MTDAELDEIEARARAATPGRWWCETGGLPGAWCLMAFIDDGEPKPVKAVLATRPPWEHRAEVSEATGVFIAHSREDVPALVAEVRRLRAVNERAALKLDEWSASAAQRARLAQSEDERERNERRRLLTSGLARELRSTGPEEIA